MKRHKQLPKHIIPVMANITMNKLPYLNHYLTVTFSPIFVAIKFFIERKNFHYLLHFHIGQDILELAIYCVKEMNLSEKLTQS